MILKLRPRSSRRWLLALCLALPFSAAGCTEDETGPEYDRKATWEALGLSETEDAFGNETAALQTVKIDPKPVVGEDYDPIFPEPIPFDPSDGWQTSTHPLDVGDPSAKKGGSILFSMSSWPATIRTEGPNSRLSTTANMHSMIYEPLLSFSLSSNDFAPALATHWKVSEDKRIFTFRLDPRARWADGLPVTADDVKASYEHLTNKDRRDPIVVEFYKDLIKEVRILDQYTVEIEASKPRWRSMLSIGQLTVYPARYIRMDGDTYIGEWNWKLPPGSGPYEIKPESVKKGQSISLTRRDDFWGRDLPQHAGMYNFDEIRYVVVRDEGLLYSKFIKGEIDLFGVTKAQSWVDEYDKENVVQKGWVQKRKIYNFDPQGFGGYCFNMRKTPFDNVLVRKAFAHLFNREKLFAKFFFYQYEYHDTYFPSSQYRRKNAERIRFDPKKALALLAEAGWVKRDGQGYLVNEAGERFPKLTVEFISAGFERIHALVKNDLWQQAGIEMELKRVDYPSYIKRVWEYKFDLTFFSWTGSAFPRPEGSWHGKYADQPQTNNLTGMKNDKLDALMDAYEDEWDAKKRVEMLQEVDQILFDEHPYALGWGAPYTRYLYWDKFGHPAEYFSRFARDAVNVMAYWWFDPDKAANLVRNKSRNAESYPGKPLNQYDPIDQTYWLTHDQPIKASTAEADGDQHSGVKASEPGSQ
ncbi:MAG: extracellular solute-binding protein [Planctomycetota bacterium]